MNYSNLDEAFDLTKSMGEGIGGGLIDCSSIKDKCDNGCDKKCVRKCDGQFLIYLENMGKKNV